MKIIVDDTTKPRLDVYLSAKLADMTRARIQALLKSGDILVNGAVTKPKAAVIAGDSITISIPEPVSEEAQPEDIPLHILYEDEEIIVINKDSGLVVHPAAGNRTGTLVNALLYHCGKNFSGIGEADRPGIVHRLDKDTSGCIIVAKTNFSLLALVKQFADRTTKKQYLCVVQGVPNKPADSIFTNIGRHPVNRMKMTVHNPGSGKPAITDYEVLGTLPETDSSLIKCDIHTGRTHQIRVHMVHIGTPILADPIYSKPARQQAKVSRLMLHAHKLTVTHPRTLETLQFIAPIPEEYKPWTDAFL